MCLNDRLWLCVINLTELARQRVRSALDGNRQSGALSLEWIVIAGLLVAAAAIAYRFFHSAIDTWESKMTAGS
jgi:hypothetical protein